MLKDVLKTLKINHWIKNCVVIVPLIFSLNCFNLNLWLRCAIIFASFCFISSAVYIMNDLTDVESDKKHPVKRFRPIADGKISKSFAVSIMLLLIILSALSALKLNLSCFGMIVSYFVLNVFYSLFLKRVALIDAACIATGFILRIVGGCFAIGVLPSPLVILLTFFTSMFFTFSKRKLELAVNGNSCRKSTENFDTNMINRFISINAVLAIAFYFTYVLDTNTVLKTGATYLYLTVIPFTLIIFRLLLLTDLPTKDDDPVHFIEKDKAIHLLFLFYFVTLMITMTVIK